MAWSTPLTASSGATLTAAQWNASVRDNLNETSPAKATTAGGYFVATGVNAIAERIADIDSVETAQTTTSLSYTDLATAGPAVTVTTSANALVVITSRVSNSTAGAWSFMGTEMTGASAISASLSTALMYESGAASDIIQASYVLYRQDLTPGSNTFTAKYRVTAGTGSWESRRLSVLPY